MDLDNIGPIALFIAYMAISAWSKQKKARQRTGATEKPKAQPSSPISKPLQEVGGILDQLKKELFEIDEEPLVFQQTEPEYEEEEEVEVSEPVIEAEAPQHFTEGSLPHDHRHPLLDTIELEEEISEGQSLEEILEPYSKVEQGIILHEILGKPRARQENEDWFHRS